MREECFNKFQHFFFLRTKIGTYSDESYSTECRCNMNHAGLIDSKIPQDCGSLNIYLKQIDKEIGREPVFL